MKNSLLLSLVLLLCCCKQESNTSHVINVNTQNELNSAIKNSNAGDEIVLSNGVWKDVQIKFRGKGTKDSPITIKAETAGKVIIEGESYLKFGGEY